MSNEQELTKGQKGYLKRIINEFKADAEKAIQEVTHLKTKLLDGNEEEDSLLKQFEDSEEKIKKISSEITDFYDTIFYAETNDTSLAQDIKGYVDEFKELNDEVTEIKEKIESYRDELFGQELDEEIIEEGLKHKVEEFINDLKKLHETYSQKHQNLHSEIEELLQGASTVALSKAFNDHKESFNKSNITWLIVFVGSVLLMMGMSVWAFISSEYTFTEMWKYTLGNIPFLGGAIWLAIYASKQRSQNKRLQQEYAFKEDVAKIYYGLKKEIEDIGESELGKKLNERVLSVIIDVVSLNPSETLDHKSHDDKGPVLDALRNITETLKEIKPPTSK